MGPPNKQHSTLDHNNQSEHACATPTKTKSPGEHGEVTVTRTAERIPPFQTPTTLTAHSKWNHLTPVAAINLPIVALSKRG